MFFFSFYLIESTGDKLIYQIFFNYSNNCYLDCIFSYSIEFFLFIYVLYNILLYQDQVRLRKQFFYNFIFILLLLNLLGSLLYFYHTSFFLIGVNVMNNGYTITCKIITISLTILILLFSKNKILYKNKNMLIPDLLSIFGFLLIFICLLYSSVDLFLIYLSIEGISFILYTLGSLINKSLINIEAIIKYFLINNIASSFLLWSISYIYILIGTTDCFELQYYLITSLETIISHKIYPILFVLIGSFLFKLAVFPLHWWLADIYEGFWTPITLTYAVLIKLAFFLFFFKLILNLLYPLIFIFQPFLIISAIGSIILGSFGAITQVKIKRFLAYTSISQSGYILMGLASNTLNGALGAFLYLIMYTLVSLSFFLILLNLEHINKRNNIIYLNQLYSIIFYNKEITLHLISIIFIMAAIPPFNSFFAKFFILIISLESKIELISCLMLIFSLLSSFYYLNFVQQLVFFKVNKLKIFIYNENFFNTLVLRLNSFFFFISIFWLPEMYHLSFLILKPCLWPLSCI